MSNKLYSNLAGICHVFYRQYFPHQKIADNLHALLKSHGAKNIVFIGGLVYVARELERKGYTITFVDYTPEMLAQAKRIVKKAHFVLADMRSLRLPYKVDAVLTIGRSFTYMYDDADALKTLRSFARLLNKTGIVVIDNYETGKIDKGSYFNGHIRTQNKDTKIVRSSTIKKIKTKPTLYRWDAIYKEKNKGRSKSYNDPGHILRSFSKLEIERLITKSSLEFLMHKANFERKSFITIARKSIRKY